LEAKMTVTQNKSAARATALASRRLNALITDEYVQTRVCCIHFNPPEDQANNVSTTARLNPA
jgi:hypothetical protein